MADRHTSNESLEGVSKENPKSIWDNESDEDIDISDQLNKEFHVIELYDVKRQHYGGLIKEDRETVRDAMHARIQSVFLHNVDETEVSREGTPVPDNARQVADELFMKLSTMPPMMSPTQKMVKTHWEWFFLHVVLQNQTFLERVQGRRKCCRVPRNSRSLL